MFIPLWLLIALALLAITVFGWTVQLALGRNPFPFPDPGSRIFSAASPEAKRAIVELLGQHGIKERFRADSDGVLRSILWDGTIINMPTPATVEKLDGASSCIGLVAADPEASAREAAAFLVARGFSARVVLDIEPGLPIAFVVTDAFRGTVINFRKHMIHLPRPQPARD
jgi:hypothetical protein